MAIAKARKNPLGLVLKNRSGWKLRRIITYIFTMLTLLFTVVYAVVDLPALYSVAPRVDSFVHVASFEAGAIISLYLGYRYKDSML